ncbi:MAG: DNA mismatch repair endonuclease MutL [Prevotella sp.]
MSDVIQLLPDSVANQIAAGEVIQRPASVIKELMENAVDAGAQHINVLVVDAGRTSIQVIDDGKGMSETDARLSFERHATSKIRMADDLFNLHTMGFRGEALASIAAVSHIELKTRTAKEEIGTQLSIAGSKFTGQEPCACPVGANFKVENLFYNVPARRKFLKSNTTELNHIITAFERIALVYPKVAFTFHSNGSEMYDLRAGGLRQRIVDIFGKRINQDLLPVNVETSVCGLGGFVGKPESAKKRGVHQYFFVNGRYMRHPYFHKAVMQVYERLIPQGTQIPYFLYFDVDPKDIDVNIHPTKTEIKFENEQAIWQILFASIKDAIGRFSDMTTIEFDTEGKPDIPVYDPGLDAQLPQMNLNPQYNPFNSNERKSEHRSKVGGGFDGGQIIRSRVPEQWDQLYEGLETETSSVSGTLFTGSGESEESLIADKSPSHYQYKGRYIMTAVKSGLMIVDQHRAHVRMLFEQYQKQLSARKMHSQKVLFPETLQLSVQENTTFQSIHNEIKTMGFELSDLGGSTYAVYAIPEGLEGIDVLQLLRDMIASVREKGVADINAVNDSLALSMARAAAVPYGQVLSNEEMEGIINGLFVCSNVNYTPDGKTILYILKQEEIEQMLR